MDVWSSKQTWPGILGIIIGIQWASIIEHISILVTLKNLLLKLLPTGKLCDIFGMFLCE